MKINFSVIRQAVVILSMSPFWGKTDGSMTSRESKRNSLRHFLAI